MCIAFRVWRGRFRAWGRDGFRALRLEQAVAPLKKESYNGASMIRTGFSGTCYIHSAKSAQE